MTRAKSRERMRKRLCTSCRTQCSTSWRQIASLPSRTCAPWSVSLALQNHRRRESNRPSLTRRRKTLKLLICCSVCEFQPIDLLGLSQWNFWSTWIRSQSIFNCGLKVHVHQIVCGAETFYFHKHILSSRRKKSDLLKRERHSNSCAAHVVKGQFGVSCGLNDNKDVHKFVHLLCVNWLFHFHWWQFICRSCLNNPFINCLRIAGNFMKYCTLATYICQLPKLKTSKKSCKTKWQLSWSAFGLWSFCQKCNQNTGTLVHCQKSYSVTNHWSGAQHKTKCGSVSGSQVYLVPIKLKTKTMAGKLLGMARVGEQLTFHSNISM